MCYLRNIGFIMLCSLCLLGCRSSVWESDACKNIDHSISCMRYIDYSRFQSPKEDKLFHISESLVLSGKLYNDFLWIASGCEDKDSMTALSNAVKEAPDAQKLHVISAISGLKKTSHESTERNNGAAVECVDINTAEIAQLITLPGIGRARAESIVQARNKRAFKRKKDITRIKGISAKSYQKLQGYLCEI